MSAPARALNLDRETQVSRIAQFFRRLMQRRLADLKMGSVTFHDGLGTVRLGDSEAPHFDVQVYDLRFYREVVIGGSLGAAQSYMNGDWHCDDLTGLFRLFARNADHTDDMDSGLARWAARAAAWNHRRNRNSMSGSKRNVGAHYDLGNDLFALFLDETMTYSAGIFATPDTTLREASIAKLDRICRKLRLSHRHHVLEIGSGWGSFAIHAASHFDCRVTTTTISEQQFELAGERIRAAGLERRIKILHRDYRELCGRFDKIVSIEMIEAVGHDYLPVYFKTCSDLLKADGQMLLQGIAMPDQRYAQYLKNSDFIQRYVFPGSCCPAVSAMLDAVTKSSDMKLAHLEDIGPHYATTLRHWRERFDASEEQVLAQGYPRDFIRMWRYYLSYCEAGFAERYLSDVQMVLNKPRYRGAPLLGELEMPAT